MNHATKELMFDINDILCMGKHDFGPSELGESGGIPVQCRGIVRDGYERFTECDAARARANLQKLICGNSCALSSEIRHELCQRVRTHDHRNECDEEEKASIFRESVHWTEDQNFMDIPNKNVLGLR